MTENWEGFSPAEILNIKKSKSSLGQGTRIQITSPLKTAVKQNKYGKKNITRENILKTQISNECCAEGKQIDNALPQEAMLFIPHQLPEESESEVSAARTESVISIPTIPVKLDSTNNVDSQIFVNYTSLDDFEKRQNMIKEQNRQRKELLIKALDDRTKRTHEEAHRLGQIEEELKKLDLQLSNDVSILRNQIEVASLEFMEAQKRFDRAEREYLDAKLALFNKKERKELLTGHLCTIIEQNELHKAKKLSDLMDKLQLGPVIIEKPIDMSSKNAIESSKQVTKKPELKEEKEVT